MICQWQIWDQSWVSVIRIQDLVNTLLRNFSNGGTSGKRTCDEWVREWNARVNVRVCEWGVRVNVRVCEWGVRVNVRVCE